MVLQKRRLPFLIFLALVVAAGLWGWSKKKGESQGAGGDGSGKPAVVLADPQTERTSREANRREEKETSYPEIDALLADDTRDEADTGLALLERATQSSLSLGERRAAMEHALLLLGSEQGHQLLAVAADRELPDELAGMMIDSFMNYEDPLRLQGALEISRRHAGEARREAMDLLRFIMDGEDEEEPGDLQKRAEERLLAPEE